MKFELNWPVVSEEKMFENVDRRRSHWYMCIVSSPTFGSCELKNYILHVKIELLTGIYNYPLLQIGLTQADPS